MELDTGHAMVVLSGGQDSTTCLGIALDCMEKVSCITFDYGQKHAIELEAAKKVVEFYEGKYDRKIPHEIVKIGDIFAGTSPLTNPNEELETYADHTEMEAVIGDRVEKTFVPMRNAVFLMLAANRAVVAGASVLVTGVCEADNANYPDCRAIFVNYTEAAINAALGTEHGPVRFVVSAPLINKDKAASILLAQDIPYAYDALAWSHTAYDGKYPPTGKDHASILRAEGFRNAMLPDPLVVRAWMEGLMELPETDNYKSTRRGEKTVQSVPSIPLVQDPPETENPDEAAQTAADTAFNEGVR